MILNLSMLIAKLRGRKTMILGRNSKLMWSARIYNLQDSDTKISVGENCVVRGELLTFSHGGEISIGQKCYIGEGVRIWSGSRVTIGNFVMIAHGVSIMDNLTHPLNHLARRDQFHSLLTVGHPADIKLDDKPVFIDDDAWIGVNSVILRGVKIGKRAIVGAGSVVVDDVPDDHIVAGNPARLIRVNNQKSTAD